MSNIDKATVKHVALLSRLALGDDEIATYSSQLEAILRYISKLNELDTKDTPPTSHALRTLKNVFRKDAARPSLDVDDVLANAPAKDGDFFRVPPVIEGK